MLVNGLPGAGKTTLATRLAAHLGVPLISKDAVKEALSTAVPAARPDGLGGIAMEAVWAIAERCAGTVVLDSWWFRPRDLTLTIAAWRRCGEPALVEIWCEVPAELARSRVLARVRHPVHEDARRLATSWDDWTRRGEPLAIGKVVRVDTSVDVDIAAVLPHLAD